MQPLPLGVEVATGAKRREDRGRAAPRDYEREALSVLSCSPPSAAADHSTKARSAVVGDAGREDRFSDPGRR